MTEFSEENYHFYQLVTDYKKIDRLNDTALNAMAIYIYNRYVRAGSEKEVNYSLLLSLTLSLLLTYSLTPSLTLSLSLSLSCQVNIPSIMRKAVDEKIKSVPIPNDIFDAGKNHPKLFSFNHLKLLF